MPTRSKLFVSLAIVLISLAPSIPAVPETGQRTVVVLNSYHQGFVWTDRIMEGLSASLASFGNRLDLRIEYLDAKRRPPTGTYRPSLAAAMGIKYSGVPVDAVVVSDNAALDFLIENRATLFPGVPVIFCGINNFSPSMLKDQKGITGVSEDPDFVGTISLALRMTGASSVVLITDPTDTGVQNHAIALRALRETGIEADHLELSGRDYDLDELKDILRSLDSRWTVILLDFFQDKWGAYLSLDTVIPEICAASAVPVFTHADLYFGLGPVGGILNRGIDQGRTAGSLVARILDGESVDSIPILTPSIPVPTFDYRYLVRHGLLKRELPEHSLVLYKPFSVWETYRAQLIGTIMTFLSLVALIVALVLTMAGRRRAEIALSKNREQLRSIYDGMNDAVFIHDPVSAAIIDANGAVTKSFGYSIEELRTLRIADLSEFPNDETQRAAESLIRRAANGERLLQSWRARRKDGTLFTAEVSLCGANAGGQDVVIVSARDVTEKERANAEIERSLREKETLLGEIHHRVKNNFQIISSLLDLQLMEIQQTRHEADPSIIALREPRDRVHAMALVHELLYRTGDYSAINLAEYLQELASYISLSYDSAKRGIDYVLEAEDILIDIDRAVPCGLVVNELLVNACKYAFPPESDADRKSIRGAIGITATAKDGVLRLTIHDNGVGIPQAILDGVRPGGLGLTLVRSLAQQLKGSLTLSRGSTPQGASGTSVVLEFPQV